MTAKTAKTKDDIVTDEVRFSKEQLVNSKQFTNRKDALSVIIEDDEELTIDEVNDRLNKFMSEEVK